MGKARTIGFEFEVADVDKERVTLPAGWSWSADETIVNSTGRIVRGSSRYGGELNSRPLSICQRDREEVREVLARTFAAGGRCIWCHGFAVHVQADDMGLDELKRVFLLSYHTSEFIKEWADVGPWSEYSNQAPTPTLEFAVNAREADNPDRLKNVFANSSAKGFVRHLVNITSYWKHGTVEFRIFNPTYDFGEVESSALFALRFVSYAVSHTEDDFARIGSMSDFRRELRLSRPLAGRLAPLVFSGDQTSEQDRYVSRVTGMTKGMVSVLLGQAREELATANPNMYQTELAVYDKVRLTIYNADEFNHVIYLLATGRLRIEYRGSFSFLQERNGDTPERQVTCLLLFHRLKKFDVDNEYYRREFGAYKAAIDDSVERVSVTAAEIVRMFGLCGYVLGTVEDAVRDGRRNIFYQYANNSKTRTTVAYLRSHSDYAMEFDAPVTDHYGLLERFGDGQRFMMVSRNAFLPLHKAAKSGRQIFYTNAEPVRSEVEVRLEGAEGCPAAELPPDGLEIDDPGCLRIAEVTPKCFLHLQREFIRKVAKVMMPRFAFVVLYGKFLLGGFGFLMSKDREYDLWLLSDFCTNNAVPRLSKLILLSIQTNAVKRMLQRRLRTAIERVYTKVYTSNAVSMKYSGVFDKVRTGTKEKFLKYETRLGVVADESGVVDTYRRILSRKR